MNIRIGIRIYPSISSIQGGEVPAELTGLDNAVDLDDAIDLDDIFHTPD